MIKSNLILSFSLIFSLAACKKENHTKEYKKGWMAGALFVSNAIQDKKVYLGPLVVSNTMSISKCVFLTMPRYSTAIEVDNVPTNSHVYINVMGSIEIDATTGDARFYEDINQ